MNNRDRFALVLVLVGLALGDHAVAQPASSAKLLEQQVGEELLVEGISLSRLGLSLSIREVDGAVEVALLDLDDGRPVDARVIASLPADAGAASAQLTIAVSSMVKSLAPSQAQASAPAPPIPAAAAPPLASTPAPIDEEAEADKRREYDRRYIAFDDVYAIDTIHQFQGTKTGQGSVRVTGGSTTSVTRHAFAYQGTQRIPLEGADFYAAIDRPDLEARYRSRRSRRIAGITAGSVALVGAGVLLVKGITSHYVGGLSDCDFLIDGPDGFPEENPNYDACEAAHDATEDRRERAASASMKKYLVGAAIVGGIGGAALGISLWTSPHPVDEAESKRLADQHNEELRRSLGLRSSRARPVRDRASVRLAPYVGTDGGGVVLDGRF